MNQPAGSNDSRYSESCEQGRPDVDRAAERALDEYLVALSQAGSLEALDGLARRWTPRLLGYTSRMLGGSNDAVETARDVVQETWVGVIRGLRSLRDPAQFPGWIYGIATRKCADAIRANTRRRQLNKRDTSDLADEQGAIPTWEDQIDVSTAIRGLPPTHRAVVHLFYLEDFTVEEIASVLGIPVGTVKSRLHHAREALKHALNDAASSRNEPTSGKRGTS
jgi:RNA polymerase sigma-70 factor (ECF subfamily)